MAVGGVLARRVETQPCDAVEVQVCSSAALWGGALVRPVGSLQLGGRDYSWLGGPAARREEGGDPAVANIHGYLVVIGVSLLLPLSEQRVQRGGRKEPRQPLARENGRHRALFELFLNSDTRRVGLLRSSLLAPQSF